MQIFVVGFRLYFPTPSLHTRIDTPVARMEAVRVAGNINTPNIAMLVKVAKIPPAGVKPPCIYDWNAAASDPVH